MKVIGTDDMKPTRCAKRGAGTHVKPSIFNLSFRATRLSLSTALQQGGPSRPCDGTETRTNVETPKCRREDAGPPYSDPFAPWPPLRELPAFRTATRG